MQKPEGSELNNNPDSPEYQRGVEFSETNLREHGFNTMVSLFSLESMGGGRNKTKEEQEFLWGAWSVIVREIKNEQRRVNMEEELFRRKMEAS